MPGSPLWALLATLRRPLAPLAPRGCSPLLPTLPSPQHPQDAVLPDSPLPSPLLEACFTLQTLPSGRPPFSSPNSDHTQVFKLTPPTSTDPVPLLVLLLALQEAAWLLLYSSTFHLAGEALGPALLQGCG